MKPGLVNCAHMREAIYSMIQPLAWLANSTSHPQRSPSGRPGSGGLLKTQPIRPVV